MIDSNNIQKTKEIIEEFFQKMTITAQSVDVSFLPADKDLFNVVNISTTFDEPQILIGEKGQTLFEIQRLLKTILNKRLQVLIYLDLDINDYKKKKVEYLKNLAKGLADEVSITKEEKVLFPMSAYERRIVHTELSQRADIITDSQGEGQDRHIVIKPK
jgi:spoIIIJ-associated protein